MGIPVFFGELFGKKREIGRFRFFVNIFTKKREFPFFRELFTKKREFHGISFFCKNFYKKRSLTNGNPHLRFFVKNFTKKRESPFFCKNIYKKTGIPFFCKIMHKKLETRHVCAAGPAEDGVWPAADFGSAAMPVTGQTCVACDRVPAFHGTFPRLPCGTRHVWDYVLICTALRASDSICFLHPAVWQMPCSTCHTWYQHPFHMFV